MVRAVTGTAAGRGAAERVIGRARRLPYCCTASSCGEKAIDLGEGALGGKVWEASKNDSRPTLHAHLSGSGGVNGLFDVSAISMYVNDLSKAPATVLVRADGRCVGCVDVTAQLNWTNQRSARWVNLLPSGSVPLSLSARNCLPSTLSLSLSLSLLLPLCLPSTVRPQLSEFSHDPSLIQVRALALPYHHSRGREARRQCRSLQ